MKLRFAVLLPIIVLVLVIIGIGYAIKQPIASGSLAQVSSTPTKVNANKHYNLCGARTKVGKACTRHVKNAGDRCFMHRGQPAM